MSVSIRLASDNALDVIALQGDLDLASCPEVLEQLGTRALAGRHLVIDLAGVTMFGAAAMTLVQTLHCDATAAGGSCCLTAVPAQILRIMTLVGFEHIVPIVHDHHEAQRRVGRRKGLGPESAYSLPPANGPRMLRVCEGMR